MIHRLAYVSGAISVATRAIRGMRIIMHHGVSEADLPAQIFREQLEYLDRRFAIIPFEEMVARLRGHRASGREVVLTFDDGLHNNFTHAYPLLRELGIPATFFICPGIVESGGRIWTTEARLRLLRMPPGRRSELARRWGVRTNDAEELGKWLTTRSTAARDQALAELAELTPELDHDETIQLQTSVMRWPEIEALDESLITIGSHTTSHAVLTACTDAELVEEIKGSRDWLEERLSRRVRYFCYPNRCHSARVVQEVKEHYNAAVGQCGLVTSGSDMYRLPRIPAADNAEYLAWRLLRPEA
jgi:peptidoglycan/xylan/chitin deacetylase (PgdA/CDA1 family)